MATAETTAVAGTDDAAYANRPDMASATDLIVIENLLEQVHVDPEMNSRLSYNENKMQELQDSIEAIGGLLQPIIVCLTKPGTKTNKPYTLVAGFRRCICLKRLHDLYEGSGRDGSIWVKDIPAVNLVSIDSADYHAVQAVENYFRAEITPVEFAQSIERAMEDAKVNGHPMTQAEYAARTGMAQSTVSQYLAVGRLDKKILELITENKIPFKSALIIATKVPVKSHTHAAKNASTMSAVDFEIWVEKKFGKSNIQAAQNDSAATAQKIRRTKPAKEVVEVYIPELNRRLAAATDEASKQKIAIAIDALNFFMNVDGTQLGKDLLDFEQKRDQEKLAAHAAEEQGKGLTRLKNSCIIIIRGIVNKHIEPGERRPTVEEALLKVKESLLKDYNAETKIIKVPAGKAEDGKPVEVTDVKVDSIDEFLKTVHQAWNKAQADAKSRADKLKESKKKAADAAANPAAANNANTAAPVASA